jgi:hypothetical protein
VGARYGPTRSQGGRPGLPLPSKSPGLPIYLIYIYMEPWALFSYRKPQPYLTARGLTSDQTIHIPYIITYQPSLAPVSITAYTTTKPHPSPPTPGLSTDSFALHDDSALSAARCRSSLNRQ